MRLLVCLILLSGCDTEESLKLETMRYYVPTSTQEVDDRFCGDNVCDVDLGEGWKNCIDCVNDDGLPKDGGYCGDGFCYAGTENLILCPKDCRPLPLNKNPEVGVGPGPLPGPY